jgi:cytochrome b561
MGMSESCGYSPLAKWLHWIMAAFVLSIVPIGLTMTRLPSGKLQDNLFVVHESFGATVLALACLRLAVRLIRGAPAPYPGLPRWQRLAADVSHRTLYVLVIVLPLLGWAGTSAYRAPISVYGLFELPPIVAANRPLSDVLFGIHMAGAYLLAAIVAVHIGAALMHGFVRHDGVLARMLPAGWGDRLSALLEERQRGRRGRPST